MKSRIRSRSAATSGLGLKSIGVLLVECSGKANSAAPVAGEKLAVLLQQPRQLQLGDSGQVALDDPRRVAAGQFRRDREEEVVDVSGAFELVVEAGAALAEQGLDAELGLQLAQCLGDVDELVMAD